MRNPIRKLVGQRSRTVLPSERVSVSYTSEVSDYIRHRDGRTETINHGHNVMLNSFLPLIADLLANGAVQYTEDTGLPKSVENRGLKYWAIGTGSKDWDTEADFATVRINITQSCIRSGIATVVLSGLNSGASTMSYEVNLTAGDTPETVATKIAGMNVQDWTAERVGSAVTFIAKTKGVRGDSEYRPGDTGAVGNVTLNYGKNDTPRPVPHVGQNGITGEFYRKPILFDPDYDNNGIHFLDDSGHVSATPTNILEIKLTFGEEEGVEEGKEESEWRTFGIVGGLNATEELGSGYYMNCKNHGVIVKTRTMIVERRIRFTFTNADE